MDGSEFFKQLHKLFSAGDHVDFEKVFGEVMGKHLWEKWSNYASYNFVAFIGTLDGQNREKLFNYLADLTLEIPF